MIQAEKTIGQISALDPRMMTPSVKIISQNETAPPKVPFQEILEAKPLLNEVNPIVKDVNPSVPQTCTCSKEGSWKKVFSENWKLFAIVGTSTFLLGLLIAKNK